MTDVEQNKTNVIAFVESAFAGRPEEAVERYVGDTYIQHNPEAPDGTEAFATFVHGLREANPDLVVDVKRVIAEGDLVVTHSNMVLKPGERGLALADIFRLEDGKIVEHWDVIQPVPEEAANPNGMF